MNFNFQHKVARSARIRLKMKNSNVRLIVGQVPMFSAPECCPHLLGTPTLMFKCERSPHLHFLLIDTVVVMGTHTSRFKCKKVSIPQYWFLGSPAFAPEVTDNMVSLLHKLVHDVI